MKNFLPALACVCLLSGLYAPRVGAQIRPPEGEATPVAPEIPKYPDVRMPGERGIAIGGSVWLANPQPHLFKGDLAPSDYPGNLALPGKPKYDQGFEFSFAAGLHNTLRASYFNSSATGFVTAPGTNTYDFYWGRHYASGTKLESYYRIRGVKLSFEYLTWPYPVKTSSFRLRTLWQLHYIGAYGRMDAPDLPLQDANGNPYVDSNGDLLSYKSRGTRNMFLPAVGLGMQQYLGRRVRLEASASGFAFPRRANLWDAEASANFRLGMVEIRAGARGYHFRTSPKGESWVRGTMAGPFFGIRMYTD